MTIVQYNGGNVLTGRDRYSVTPPNSVKQHEVVCVSDPLGRDLAPSLAYRVTKQSSRTGPRSGSTRTGPWLSTVSPSISAALRREE